MTDQTPVERAASYIITKPRKGARTYREYAQDAYEAIDTNHLALAVKNWLTGKDQQ